LSDAFTALILVNLIMFCDKSHTGEQVYLILGVWKPKRQIARIILITCMEIFSVDFFWSGYLSWLATSWSAGFWLWTLSTFQTVMLLSWGLLKDLSLSPHIHLQFGIPVYKINFIN
jgi:hypothetical protein